MIKRMESDGESVLWLLGGQRKGSYLGQDYMLTEIKRHCRGMRMLPEGRYMGNVCLLSSVLGGRRHLAARSKK